MNDFLAGEDLGISGGALTIHDSVGIPIPIEWVAAGLVAILKKWSELQSRPMGSQPQQVKDLQISSLLPSTASTAMSLHCVDLHGLPIANATTLISGLTIIDAASTVRGLYSAAPGATLTAPADTRVSLATTGKLAGSLKVPTKSSELQVDGHRIVVEDLKKFLIGDPPNDPEPTSSPRPEVRHEEKVEWFLNGQAVLGAANSILAASGASHQIVVAPEIRGDFSVPTSGQDHDSQWPDFPPPVGGASGVSFAGLRERLELSAVFEDGASQTPSKNVILTIDKLPLNVAVRVYHRLFSVEEAEEARGDGAAGISRPSASDPSVGTLTLKLDDPLNLQQTPQSSVRYALIFDLRVTTREEAPSTRLFGALQVGVGFTPTTFSQATGTNLFQNATFIRSSAPSDLLGTHESGAGESTAIQRELPRMVRREAIIAAQSSQKKWSALVAGTRLVREALNSLQSFGSPGGNAGPEYDSLGLATRDGNLAYDLARAGLRRAISYDDRMSTLDQPAWQPPSASPTQGDVSAAVLQTIGALSKLANGAALVDWAKLEFNQTLIDNNQDPFQSRPLARQEHDREYQLYKNGRHDAFWAMRTRIQKARRLIYIDGLGFSHTGYPGGALQDLWTALDQRLTDVPGLNLILCLSKYPDYTKAYTGLRDDETALRWNAVQDLQRAHPNQVLAYHPIAFPGRPLTLLTNLMVIDDVWAMIGTSSFRRRGFSFDGGCDVVLAGYAVEDSASSTVANLRRKRMAGHLGLLPATGLQLPTANWVRIQSIEGACVALRDLLRAGGGSGIEPLLAPKRTSMGLITSLVDPEN